MVILFLILGCLAFLFGGIVVWHAVTEQPISNTASVRIQLGLGLLIVGGFALGSALGELL